METPNTIDAEKTEPAPLAAAGAREKRHNRFHFRFFKVLFYRADTGKPLRKRILWPGLTVAGRN